jgi:two-component system, NarL family, response regulator NreC
MVGGLPFVAGPEVEGTCPEEGVIGVVLLDRHAAVRRSLRCVLDGEHDIEVIADVDDLDSLMHHLSAQPRVLGLDPWLPGTSGVQTLRAVRRRAPDVGMVVLTMNADPDLALHVLGVGALGFVLKDVADTDLPPAVRSVACGRPYVSPRVATRLARRELA